ncbi:MAG TPA: hypothetical protein VLG92_02135 [Candidatus Saccharimonadia bacterium]|nr:hypothetical protein [Candidatus Saccharimonadia bacterium]
MTSHEPSQWPEYASPHDALLAETSSWGSRLAVAQARHNELDGELPPGMSELSIVILDGNTEPADEFSLPRLYSRRNLDPRKFGALFFINYEGDEPPDNAVELAEAIRIQRDEVSVSSAIALVGYQETRNFPQLRTDAFDISVAHALACRIRHPVVAVSNDGDMVKESPDYHVNMTQNEYVNRPAMVWGSAVRFDQPGGPSLPLNRLVRYANIWSGLFGQYNDRPVMYSGSLGLTLETYAIAGGWTGTTPHPYGISESTRLIMNVWERSTGRQGSMGDTKPVYTQCARRVGGLAIVSPRREIEAFSRELGRPNSMVDELTTEPNNPYRGLRHQDVARLAATIISADDPEFRAHLDAFDSGWLPLLPEDRHEEAKEALREARRMLQLPIASFDG